VTRQAQGPMMKMLHFAGPNGPYSVSLDDDRPSVEGKSLVVVANDETSHWTIEVDDDTSGIRELSGMTGDGSGLWFVLRLGSFPEMQYWGDRVLIRTDKTA
jgi:hypothetical protein